MDRDVSYEDSGGSWKTDDYDVKKMLRKFSRKLLQLSRQMVVTDVDALDQKKNVFGNVGRVIGDSFEVVRDEDQIERGANRGLALFQHAEQFRVDGVFQVVDFVVG